MLCEMCSKNQATVKVDLEGARLGVCEQCSRHGKIVGRIQQPSVTSKGKASMVSASSAKATETVQLIKSDFSLAIRKAREKLGLTQHDLAARMNEKESVMHNIESGRMKPNIDLARKIEKFLKISIIEEVEVESVGSSQLAEKSGPLTLGDLIKFK